MKILTVDDDHICRLVMSGYLNRLGFDCDVVNSGQEAINAFDKTFYDIMFIDYMMPDMNGIDTSKIILS